MAETRPRWKQPRELEGEVRALLAGPLDDTALRPRLAAPARETALALYDHDPAAARPYLLGWRGPEAPRLAERARERGDDDFYFALYRRHVPFKEWAKEALRLCEEVREPDLLVEALVRRHPER